MKNKILDVITRITIDNVNNILNWGDRVLINNVEGNIEYIGAEDIIIKNNDKKIAFRIKDIVNLNYVRPF